MRGMCAETGRPLDGIGHLRQSVRDILTTPIGSRVHRRAYGSRLPRLVDAPLNGETLVELYAATAESIARWEPRFRLASVTAEPGEPGRVVLALTGTYLPDGREITLEGIIV